MAPVVAELVEHFDWHGPIGVTFPGVVRHGVIHSAANVDKAWLGTDADALFTKASAAPMSTSSTTPTPPGWPRSASAPDVSVRASSSC